MGAYKLALLLFFVSVNAWSEGVEFENITLGLYDANKGKVVEQVGVIAYKENAVCVVDNKDVDCLYYGLSLNYKVDVDKTLVCNISLDKAVEDAREEDVIAAIRVFELGAADDYFFIPGYLIKDDGDHGVYELCLICQVDEEEVIRKRLLVDMGAMSDQGL